MQKILEASSNVVDKEDQWSRGYSVYIVILKKSLDHILGVSCKIGRSRVSHSSQCETAYRLRGFFIIIVV